jgi:hypothetical protein
MRGSVRLILLGACLTASAATYHLDPGTGSLTNPGTAEQPITLSGARNCRIVNNTVVDFNTTSPGPPWIRIGQHKYGTASSGNIIRNNLATDSRSMPGPQSRTTTWKSVIIPPISRTTHKRDLRLLAGCPAVDAGSAEAAPTTDAAGLPRPLDGDGDGEAAWDIGAHEYLNPTADSDADGLLDIEERQTSVCPDRAGVSPAANHSV